MRAAHPAAAYHRARASHSPRPPATTPPVASSDASAPRRIALVRLSHLGDVVLALPLFHALRERFPRAELAWVVQREFAPLVEPLPGLARTLRFDRRGGLRGWLELRRELSEFAPDLAVDAQGNLKSGFALACTGAARRVGLAREDWREPLGRFALTESAAPAAGEHAFERTLALARHFGASADPRRDPALSSSELRAGRERLREFELGRGDVILQLSPARDPRSWPLEHCAELLARLGGDGRRVLALSGPAEEREGAELRARSEQLAHVKHWVGQRGLRELAALLSVAADAGVLYAGGDTGPMHLAAACGLPVTVLCGPHSHLRTGPWPIAGSGAHRAVRAAAQPACAPCLARTCNHPQGPVCMREIAPEEVRMALASVRSA
ncbi:MAG: glycosyltransferase family 9 protein [Planctomycetes bacterium]|nr:glycosyltransferase family 9 protein [Planctomycetota bacterium]